MKNEFKICPVIYGGHLENFLRKLKKAQISAAMLELRADSIDDFKAEDVTALKKATKLPSIFTLRHKREGGLFNGTIANQNKILKKAFTAGFTYVDVAYHNPLLKKLSSEEKKHLLLSWHNNEETPTREELNTILNYMRAMHPAIIKIATFVNYWEDIYTLASVLQAKKSDEKMVVIGMGKKGELTRLIFPAMGSYIAYVSRGGEKNIAPGMLTEKELKPIIKYFNK